MAARNNGGDGRGVTKSFTAEQHAARKKAVQARRRRTRAVTTGTFIGSKAENDQLTSENARADALAFALECIEEMSKYKRATGKRLYSAEVIKLMTKMAEAFFGLETLDESDLQGRPLKAIRQQLVFAAEAHGLRQYYIRRYAWYGESPAAAQAKQYGWHHAA